MDITSLYGDLIDRTYEKMVNLVGVHTVAVLIQRALWMTRQKYAEADAIRFDENGISLNALAVDGNEEQVKAVLEEFFGSLVGILTRLVGKEIAQKIAQDLEGFTREDGEPNCSA